MKLKKASPESSSAFGQLQSRVKVAENMLKSLGTAIKSKGIAKVAGSGNRAFFSATAAATAAGALVANPAVVGNADQTYDRLALSANGPALFSLIFAAGNNLGDGSGSIPTDAGQVFGPIELAEPVKVNGNGGLTFSHQSRAAGLSDASVILIPIGHSWGSANPASF